MGYRKAIYTPFPQAVPHVPGDRHATTAPGSRTASARSARSSARPTPSTSTSRTRSSSSTSATSSWPPAGSCSTARASRSTATGGWPTSTRNMEFERLCNAAGPTNGKIVLRDGKTEPEVGGHHPLRRQPRREPQRLLLGRLLHGGAEVRPPGAGEDQRRGVLVLHRHAHATRRTTRSSTSGCWTKGMHFVRGKVAEVTDAARLPAEEGKLIVQVRGHAARHASGASRSTW